MRPAHLAHADIKALQEASSLAQSGDFKKAVKKLSDVEDKNFSKKHLAQKYFALGVWSVELKKYSEARVYLEKALELETINKAHAHFLIGHTYKEEGQHEEAARYLTKTLQLKPPLNIAFQARLDLADMSMSLKKYAEAASHLGYLERRWRGDYRYPEIVWRLIGSELKRKRRWQACRWARRMYSQYPGHPLAADWGVDLHVNIYDGAQTGCIASQKELRRRIRQLQLAGQDDRARKEIDIVASRAEPSQQYEIDVMRAEFYEWQGFMDEALKLLVKHYEEHKIDFNYLMLMGKVASKAGEYQTAVGAYMQAYRLSPNSRSGRNALFSAAFLSYQFQDYDGANRKFQEFARKYRRSGLARDARWHIAWIKYLKGNYLGAEKDLRELVVRYKGRGRRRRAIQDDRVRYWLAMSELRQDNIGEAREQFMRLAKSGNESYYGLLAKYRLSQLPAPSASRQLASELNKNEAEQPSALEMTGVPVPAPAPNNTATSPEEAGLIPNGEENESEDKLEDIAGTEEEAEESADATAEVSVEASDAAPEIGAEDVVARTNFRDPRLQERFDSAYALIQLGLYDWARWELYEIERRTSNKTYLRNLMDAYKAIGSYNRSAYISEVYFSSERNGFDDKKSRLFWEASYPQAYSEHVEKWANKFGVENALVYAIMRAESHFNKNAISIVGARGLMQIMPYTAEKLAALLKDRDYRHEKLIEPDTNIRLGVRYLSRLSRKFSSQVPLAAAGYNAGPHRVYSWLSAFGHLSMDEFIEHVPFVETRNYMKKVVKNYAVYKSLYSDSKSLPLAFMTEPIPVKFNGGLVTRENWEVLD